MKLKQGKVTLLVGTECTTIQLKDSESSVTFAEVTLTPNQLSAVLSRQSHVECEIEVFGIDKIGKRMVHKYHEFDISNIDVSYNSRASVLAEEIKKTLPEGWVSDNYFGSQNTFFQRDGKSFARTIIRTWVDIAD